MQSMYPMEFLLHLVSVILSGVAVVQIIFLMPLAGKAKAWLLFSTAFFLMALERILELFAHFNMLVTDAGHEVVSDILNIAILGCLLGGMVSIRAIFLERQAVQRKLEQQVDELQHSHEAAGGKDLRMKELYEENLVLKARLGKTEK